MTEPIKPADVSNGQSVYPRVLIVGTVPYNNQSPSRAFHSYFAGWDSAALAQIFSNPSVPKKGHCGTLYQITDARMLKRLRDRHMETGQIFQMEDLDSDLNTLPQNESVKQYHTLYTMGKNKSPLVYLGRKLIWQKRHWCTPQLLAWADAFRPECVFLSFSDDFFIPEIACFFAERYGIPIVSSIGDDYYFNYRFSLNPLYHVYKLLYRRLIRRVFAHQGSAIYIGDKIRDQYNRVFGLHGETVYLTSTLTRRPFRPINTENPVISYFGNIRLGRNESLAELATALGEINPDYRVHVYSGERGAQFTSVFRDNPNVVFHDAVSYDAVQQKSLESDMLIVPEGFKKKDVDISRYSLSTKVADSLASGVCVFAYGSADCGAIAYAGETGCITTCTDRAKLKEALEKLLFDVEYQRACCVRAETVTEQNHRLENSTATFLNVVNREVRGQGNAEG